MSQSDRLKSLFQRRTSEQRQAICVTHLTINPARLISEDLRYGRNDLIQLDDEEKRGSIISLDGCVDMALKRILGPHSRTLN